MNVPALDESWEETRASVQVWRKCLGCAELGREVPRRSAARWGVSVGSDGVQGAPLVALGGAPAFKVGEWPGPGVGHPTAATTGNGQQRSCRGIGGLPDARQGREPCQTHHPQLTWCGTT